MKNYSHSACVVSIIRGEDMQKQSSVQGFFRRFRIRRRQWASHGPESAVEFRMSIQHLQSILYWSSREVVRTKIDRTSSTLRLIKMWLFALFATYCHVTIICMRHRSSPPHNAASATSFLTNNCFCLHRHRVRPQPQNGKRVWPQSSRPSFIFFSHPELRSSCP